MTSQSIQKRLSGPVLRLGNWLHMSSFDLLVALVALCLLLAIALVLLLNRSEDPGQQIIFFMEDDSGRENLYLASVRAPDELQRLTNAQSLILEFDPSPDGRHVVYSQRDLASGRSDLYLLDIRTRDVRQLTSCAAEDADCTGPVFRPDGEMLVYLRVSYNSDLGLGYGANRIWILDLRGESPTTYPLFEDPQVIGHSPIWSGNGNRLAFYENNMSGIIVYNFEGQSAAQNDNFAFIPTQMGLSGSLSPSGDRLVYPDIIADANLLRSNLQVAYLDEGYFVSLSDPNAFTDDQQTAWSPNGRFVAFARREGQSGLPTAQVYLYDTVTGEVSALIEDRRYDHSYLNWSADSEWLTMMRFPSADAFGQPINSGQLEIWAYELETGELIRFAEGARMPQWVP